MTESRWLKTLKVGTVVLKTGGSVTDHSGNALVTESGGVNVSAIDADAALAANSDAVVPSQKAVKAYIDAVDTAKATFKIATATATSDGLTTGLLTGTNQFVTVTSASANNIVSLPALGAGMVGTLIRGCVATNGFKLQVIAADATTGKLNEVTTNVKAAIPADTSFAVECISTTQWILTAKTKLGAVITAIIPS
jgi:hypothetical protein